MTPSDADEDIPPTEKVSRALEAGDVAAARRLLGALGPLFGLPGPREAGGGLTEDGEFVPFYFTDRERAEAYAQEHGFLARTDGEARAERERREVQEPREEWEGRRGRTGETPPAGPPVYEDPLAPLGKAVERGFGGVVIDPAGPRPLPLTRDTLVDLLSASDATAPDEGPERRSGAGVGESPRQKQRTAPPSPHLLDLAERVRRSPTLDPVPPPARPATEAREVVQELRELLLEDRVPLWEVVDTLAYETAFHVPVAPEPAHGLRWPLLVRHPRDPSSPSVWIFTDEEKARRSLDDVPGQIETLRLSGLEAFRWIWAVPTPVKEVVVDLYPDSPPPLFVPDTWMLGAILPHFLDCPDLRGVRRVPREEIGGLPGARGTKPECVRALVEPWIEGLGDAADVGGRGGESPEGEPVRHHGSRYLPVDSSGAWSPAPSPPFRAWLRASADYSGVLVDPDGPHPLPLDHADLAVLALWAEEGAQPDGTDLARLVEELRDDLGPAVRGRILADWPRYFWALQGGGDEPTRALTLPDRDVCPVFTSEERIRTFLDEARERGLLGGEMEPLAYLSGWAFNVFREIHLRYREGGWLDPESPRPGTGLELDPDTVRGALARIEWKLQPRVPGFLANP